MGHRHHVDPAELESLADYRRRVLSAIGPLAPIDAGLGEARGTVLATDVTAPGDIPPFPNSAMDGFALRAGESGPGVTLTVVGEVAAGAADRPSPGPGQAVRIMTGAPIPDGVDAVIPVELVSEDDGRVVLHDVAHPGDNIRHPGESVRSGELRPCGTRATKSFTDRSRGRATKSFTQWLEREFARHASTASTWWACRARLVELMGERS